MNIGRLMDAEQSFFNRYPQGFAAPEMLELAKKHRIETIAAFARESFQPDRFSEWQNTAENMVKLVSKSTMVSLFEKPRFRDFVRELTSGEKQYLVRALYELLHGDQESGFEMALEILDRGKLAKWTLLTVFGAYYKPSDEIFIKPTTTKAVISYFELEGVRYTPRPDYSFYCRYRSHINAMKAEVDPSLVPNNAAFLGFLMMSCM